MRRPSKSASETKSIDQFSFIRPGRRPGRTVGGHHVAPRPSKPHAQPLLAIQPVHALVIDLPAFPAEQDVDAEVAVAHPRRGQFPNPLSKHGLIVADCAVAMRRTVESQHRASAALAHPVGPLQVPNQLAPALRPHNFVCSTSCSISLSSERSATSCLSRRFSSSSCFIRRSSLTASPPYCFFQR